VLYDAALPIWFKINHSKHLMFNVSLNNVNNLTATDVVCTKKSNIMQE